MIPLRDTVASRHYPIINNLLIAANVFFFMAQIAQGSHQESFVFTWGLVPARYSDPGIGAYFTLKQQVLSLFTFMFLHGGFWHILGNMWFLYVFGDNVEDRMGHFRYLVFYFLCGWASGVTHLYFNWHSHLPTIGASGAIAGVMGAYFILHPRSRILTFIPLFIIPYFVEIPAFIFLGFWFVWQFLSAAGSQAQQSGIAWWAHVGGFVFGMILCGFFRRAPATEGGKGLPDYTLKTRTPRLQLIAPKGTHGGPDLYGTICVTRFEAKNGARKLVNIPRGYQKRLFTVIVPSGVREGSVLRLSGLGRKTPGHSPGDLFLKVQIC